MITPSSADSGPELPFAVPEPHPAVQEGVVERRVPGIDDRAPAPELGEGLVGESEARGLVQPERLRSDPEEAEERAKSQHQHKRHPRGGP